jgi:hypothetical protein
MSTVATVHLLHWPDVQDIRSLVVSSGREARGRAHERLATRLQPRPAVCELPAKLNLFRMLANSEGAFLPLISMVSAVFAKLELEPRHREITILFTGRRTDARYMWERQLRIAPESRSDTL